MADMVELSLSASSLYSVNKKALDILTTLFLKLLIWLIPNFGLMRITVSAFESWKEKNFIIFYVIIVFDKKAVLKANCESPKMSWCSDRVFGTLQSSHPTSCFMKSLKISNIAEIQEKGIQMPFMPCITILSQKNI